MKYLTLIFSIFLLAGFLFAAGCIEEETSKPTAIGDTVTVQFTAYIGDTAMVTSSVDTYNELLRAGKMPSPLLLIDNPTITAGSSTDDDYMTVPAKVGSYPYWFLIGEYNAMAANAVGMKKGETKTFPIYSTGTDQKVFLTNEEAAALGFDPAKLKAGDIVTYTRNVLDGEVDDDGNFDPNSAENEITMIRDMLILEVTDEGVAFQDIYDTIEMTVL